MVFWITESQGDFNQIILENLEVVQKNKLCSRYDCPHEIKFGSAQPGKGYCG